MDTEKEKELNTPDTTDETGAEPTIAAETEAEAEVLLTTDLPLPLFTRGKSRDVYDLGEYLLLVATDRISAFDVVLPCGIPNKGKVLNLLSAFWFDKTKHTIPNHMVQVVDDVNCLDNYLPEDKRFAYPSYLKGRSMIVKKTERIPIECVVRGFLTGSAWEEYRLHGTVAGIRVVNGLLESSIMPTPLFTPTTKAEEGHDMPMPMSDVEKIAGSEMAKLIEDKSIAIYNQAQKFVRILHFFIADTKMEFGILDGELILIDELLTPDSSRFWDTDLYRVGKRQDSFDKQPVRDWLDNTGWNKEPPAPMLPPEVIEQTSARYQEVYERLTKQKLS